MEVLILCVLLSCLVGANGSQFGGKIIGGTIADERHDFTVRIISAVSAQSPSGYLSSGVAISPNHVVTVGQAVDGFGIWYIGHGSIHVEDQYESISTDATAHPNYDNIYLLNNIAMIRVLSHSISTTIPIISSTTASFVFGYGIVNVDNQVVATTLKQGAIFTLPDHTTCLQMFNEFVLQPDNLCSATIGGAFLSNGNQGGPVTNSAVTGVYGIISFWSIDGDVQVAVNLNAHMDFITAQLLTI